MEDSEHESRLIKDNIPFFSKDNIDNSSYLAYGLERLLPLRQHCSAAGNIFINNTNNEEPTINTIPWQAPMLGARRCCLRCLYIRYILFVFLLSVRLPNTNGTRRICISCGGNPRQGGETPQNRLCTPQGK